jgi:hypothetical protein
MENGVSLPFLAGGFAIVVMVLAMFAPDSDDISRQKYSSPSGHVRDPENRSAQGPDETKFNDDSAVARKMLSGGGMYGGSKATVVHPPQEPVRPLDAGMLYGAADVGRYHCTLQVGDELDEIGVKPSHDGWILVQFGPPVMVPLHAPSDDPKKPCQGGEAFFVRHDDLNVIANR